MILKSLFMLVAAVVAHGESRPSSPVAYTPPSNEHVIYQALTFKSGNQILTGHLARPAQGKDRFPTVLLIAGSGPHNRYEEIGERKTSNGKPGFLFKQIEEALLSRGIAVFTYDKRGVVPEDDTYLNNEIGTAFKKATFRDFEGDGVAAFDYLKSLPEVDAKNLGVLGHGEGTAVAIRVAEVRPQVKSLFMLGLFTRSQSDLKYFQSVIYPMRIFNLLDENHEGYVDEKEYEAFSVEPYWPFKDKDNKPKSWNDMKVAFDKTGEGKISEAEWRFGLKTQFKKETEGQENVRDKAYLQRHLTFCKKINLFHGEVDQLSPFEDALELRETCEARKTPLGSFHSYADLGHGFSPRSGWKGWRDTLGPITHKVLEDISTQAEKNLK